MKRSSTDAPPGPARGVGTAALLARCMGALPTAVREAICCLSERTVDDAARLSFEQVLTDRRVVYNGRAVRRREDPAPGGSKEGGFGAAVHLRGTFSGGLPGSLAPVGTGRTPERARRSGIRRACRSRKRSRHSLAAGARGRARLGARRRRQRNRAISRESDRFRARQ